MSNLLILFFVFSDIESSVSWQKNVFTHHRSKIQMKKKNLPSKFKDLNGSKPIFGFSWISSSSVRVIQNFYDEVTRLRLVKLCIIFFLEKNNFSLKKLKKKSAELTTRILVITDRKFKTALRLHFLCDFYFCA